MIEVYTIMFFVVLGISALWVKGITNMHEKHPDYRGEDLFGDGFNFDDKKEDEEDKKDYDKN
jgi:hypothetical protein